MSNQFLGEVRCVGFNYAPYQWAECDGQILPITAYSALFSLLGNYYGGDGKFNFGLPDLQGKTAIGYGQGKGLSNRAIGEAGGAQTVTLQGNQLPQHNHNFMADLGDGPADTVAPSPSAVISVLQSGSVYSNASSPLVQMAPNALLPYGSSQPHNNMMPYLTLNFVIALTGLFPQRN